MGPVRAWRLIHKKRFTNPTQPSKNPGRIGFNRERHNVGKEVFEKLYLPKKELKLLPPRTRE